MEVSIERQPKMSTEFRLKDAARERHVGVIMAEQFMPIMGITVPEGASAKVKMILDEDGKAREIRILLD